MTTGNMRILILAALSLCVLGALNSSTQQAKHLDIYKSLKDLRGTLSSAQGSSDGAALGNAVSQAWSALDAAMAPLHDRVISAISGAQSQLHVSRHLQQAVNGNPASTEQVLSTLRNLGIKMIQMQMQNAQKDQINKVSMSVTPPKTNIAKLPLEQQQQQTEATTAMTSYILQSVYNNIDRAVSLAQPMMKNLDLLGAGVNTDTTLHELHSRVKSVIDSLGDGYKQLLADTAAKSGSLNNQRRLMAHQSNDFQSVTMDELLKQLNSMMQTFQQDMLSSLGQGSFKLGGTASSSAVSGGKSSTRRSLMEINQATSFLSRYTDIQRDYNDLLSRSRPTARRLSEEEAQQPEEEDVWIFDTPTNDNTYDNGVYEDQFVIIIQPMDAPSATALISDMLEMMEQVVGAAFSSLGPDTFTVVSVFDDYEDSFSTSVSDQPESKRRRMRSLLTDTATTGMLPWEQADEYEYNEDAYLADEAWYWTPDSMDTSHENPELITLVVKLLMPSEEGGAPPALLQLLANPDWNSVTDLLDMLEKHHTATLQVDINKGKGVAELPRFAVFGAATPLAADAGTTGHIKLVVDASPVEQHTVTERIVVPRLSGVARAPQPHARGELLNGFDIRWFGFAVSMAILGLLTVFAALTAMRASITERGRDQQLSGPEDSKVYIKKVASSPEKQRLLNGTTTPRKVSNLPA